MDRDWWFLTRWVPGLTITICNKITGVVWWGGFLLIWLIYPWDYHNELEFNVEGSCLFLVIKTIDNQRLRSADDNDRRSKCFYSISVLLRKFHVTDSQNIRDQIMSERRSNLKVPDQISSCAFQSFLREEKQMMASTSSAIVKRTLSSFSYKSLRFFCFFDLKGSFDWFCLFVLFCFS